MLCTWWIARKLPNSLFNCFKHASLNHSQPLFNCTSGSHISVWNKLYFISHQVYHYTCQLVHEINYLYHCFPTFWSVQEHTYCLQFCKTFFPDILLTFFKNQSNAQKAWFWCEIPNFKVHFITNLVWLMRLQLCKIHNWYFW